MLDTLSPFPHRRVSSRASASAASSADDVLPSSSLATPRDPSPLIAPADWHQRPDFYRNELSVGPMSVIVAVTLAVMCGGVLVASYVVLGRSLGSF